MTGGAERMATWMLAAFAGWALLAAMAAWTGLGGRYSLHPENPELATPPPELELERAEMRMGPLDQFAEIGQRPLFNPDRLPLPESGDAEGEGEDEAELAPPEPLDITLTSVVMVGELQVALFTENKSKTAHSLRVGEELEGELAGWKLVQLEPRRAVFEGPGGRSEVDLRVFDGRGGQSPTPLARAPSESSEDEDEAPADGEQAPAEEEKSVREQNEELSPESRAEMIRRRIEERRRQLREQAERENQ